MSVGPPGRGTPPPLQATWVGLAIRSSPLPIGLAPSPLRREAAFGLSYKHGIHCGFEEELLFTRALLFSDQS